MSSPKVWLITGASSGLGRNTTEYVLQKGDIAVATLRKPEALSDLSSKYPSSQLLVLKLDVTKYDEIVAAFQQVKDSFGRLDVVFNNAGAAFTAQVEASPEEMARGIFELNYWGAVNVSVEAIKFFREVNKPGVGGKLLQMTSMAGINPVKRLGHYSASKFALEGLSQALAAELRPEWNIHICILEPGYFLTRGITSLVTLPDHPAYVSDTPADLTKLGIQFGDPAKLAKVLYEIAALDAPPLHVPIGKDALRRVRQQLESLRSDCDNAEHWSEDLLL